jgi:hypothetical protein
MLTAFEAETAAGPPEQVHVGYFVAKEEPNLEGGFTVHLARSNAEFVIPAGKTILEVLRDGGMEVPCSYLRHVRDRGDIRNSRPPGCDFECCRASRKQDRHDLLRGQQD